MSGSAFSIPLSVQPFSPFIGQEKALGLDATQAGIGQTQAQTGLLSEQAKSAAIQNQIAGARLPFLMKAYGAIGGGGGQAPGDASGQSGGPPGAIGATGAQGQDWTGPGGQIMDQEGPFGQLGAIPKGVATNLMLAKPEEWATLVPAVRQQKNQYVSQAIAETLDPSTGQADPAKWNQMITNEVQQGWMTASQARNLWGHPEMAQTILNSTLSVPEMPATHEAQAAGTAAGAAPYKFVKTNVQLEDGTNQEVWVPESSLVRKSGQGGGRTGALPADLTTNIQKASKAYDVPTDDLTRLMRIESGNGDPNATSSTGAAGAAQFTGGTAQSVGITNPRDPRQAAFGTARLWRENQADLTESLGRKPTSAETYLAHQQGAVGAAALLNAPRDAIAADVFKQAGIPVRNLMVNGGTPTMTAGQFIDKWGTAWNKAGQGTQVAGPGAPTEPNPPGFAAPTPMPGAPGSALPGGTPVAAAGPVTLSPQTARLAEIDSPQIKEDAAANTANLTAGLAANKAGVMIRELRDLAEGAPTGAAADWRMSYQALARQFTGPLGERLASAVTGIQGAKPGSPDYLARMEQINKLAQQMVVANEQAIGPGVRIGAMFTNFMAKASPNINMQGPAIHQILNMGLISQQMAKDFANGSNDFYSASRDKTATSLEHGTYQRYQPLNKYEGQWTAPGSIHGPDVYAAAANLLNGVKVVDAFKGLKPDQIQEAVDVISRADPASMPTIMKRPDVLDWRKSLSAGR